jgi:glutathione S-transferase
MPSVILHQWEISPFCGKVRKILKAKGIAYSVVNYNGLRALQAARLTPVGKLPVLDYDGERVQDSSSIALFIEQKHPGKSLYPEDPVDRARCRIWEDWADESLYWYEIYFRFMDPLAASRAVVLLCEGRPAWERWLVSLVLRREMTRKLRHQGLGRMSRQRVEGNFFGHLVALDTLLMGRNWLVGDHISIADISVAAQLDEMIRTSSLREHILAYPGISNWLARCLPGT